MSTMRLIIATLCLSSVLVLGLTACHNNSNEDENASVVNVEKGVTSPVSISDNEGALKGDMSEITTGLNYSQNNDSTEVNNQPEEEQAEPAPKQKAEEKPASTPSDSSEENSEE